MKKNDTIDFRISDLDLPILVGMYCMYGIIPVMVLMFYSGLLNKLIKNS